MVGISFKQEKNGKFRMKKNEKPKNNEPIIINAQSVLNTIESCTYNFFTVVKSFVSTIEVENFLYNFYFSYKHFIIVLFILLKFL